MIGVTPSSCAPNLERDRDTAASLLSKSARAIKPSQWYAALPVPDIDRTLPGGSRARLVRFKDTPPSVDQPPLTENILVLHLGGPKRLRRERGAMSELHVIEAQRLTIIPAFEAQRWHTEGEINYAHVSISTGFLAQIAVQEFGVDPRGLNLIDRVAFYDPLLVSLFEELLGIGDDPDLVYQESLLLCMALRLLRNHSTLRRAGGHVHRPVRGGLSPWQLRRIVDYIAEHLDRPIGTEDLVELVGLSRAQFFRAFRHSTGTSPHRYVTLERVARAKTLLLSGADPIEEVAATVGFGDARQFGVLFRRMVGVSPKLFAAAKRD